VVNDHDHNRERAEKIESWLTLAVLEAWIDCKPQWHFIVTMVDRRPGWRCSIRHRLFGDNADKAATYEIRK
jgi:hypothetical protein